MVSVFRASGIELLNPDVFTTEDPVAASHVLTDRVWEEPAEDRNRDRRKSAELMKMTGWGKRQSKAAAPELRKSAKKMNMCCCKRSAEDKADQDQASELKSSAQPEKGPRDDPGSSTGAPDLARNETLVRIILQILSDACGEKESVGKLPHLLKKMMPVARQTSQSYPFQHQGRLRDQ